MRRRWRARREAIGQRLELAESTSPRGIKPSSCTSFELFFSCCVCVASLPALANFNERRGAAGSNPGTTINYLRRTASSAAENGLGTTTKYLRGAASIGLSTTIKCLQRTASAASGNGLGTTTKYLRCTTSGVAGNDQGNTIK